MKNRPEWIGSTRRERSLAYKLMRQARPVRRDQRLGWRWILRQRLSVRWKPENKPLVRRATFCN